MGRSRSRLKIVFFGTPEYVLPIAKALYPLLVAVVTPKPKPAGRKKILTYSPVDKWAYKHKFPIVTDLKSEALPEATLGVLAAYGELIPEKVIEFFPKGILVIHPSLLPQFRWSSPVQAAIITDTNPTGVTVFKMDERFDHGPIVSAFKEEVRAFDTTGSLRERLLALSARFLLELLPAYLNGKISPKEQDHSKATFARMIKKEDAFIPPEYVSAALEGKKIEKKWIVPFIEPPYALYPTPYCLYRFIRAMDPWPAAWTLLRQGYGGLAGQKRLKILKAHVAGNKLIPDVVQLEGKKPVSWEEFLSGYPGVRFASV